MMRNRTIVIGMVLAFVSVLIVASAYLLAQPISISFSLYVDGNFGGANATGDFGGANSIAHLSPDVKIPAMYIINPLTGKKIPIYTGQDIKSPDFDMNTSVGTAGAIINVGQANTNFYITGEATVPAYTLVIAYLYYSHIELPELDINAPGTLKILILLAAFILAAMIIILFKKPASPEKYSIKDVEK